MVEAPLLTQAEKPRTVVGVWLFIVTPDRNVFVTQNLKPKYESQKIPGQWNAPAETVHLEKDRVVNNDHSPISFLQGTIPRAIQEEVGSLDYDATQIKDLGIIGLAGLGKPVVASPFLIPVESESALEYKHDRSENGRCSWVHLDKITNEETITVGSERIPLFRSPMVEIAENARLALAKEHFPMFRTVGPTISQSLVKCFQT